ncbi:hypothetical protein Maes01_00646 [Microbulbifer aestuariivivens]|uniref:Uncharacterized protein n=1 Tax=Microbulbifer aestuariivivens TaxID=1908308 RepID=A0ABP9WP77_9GAMM
MSRALMNWVVKNRVLKGRGLKNRVIRSLLPGTDE